MKKFFYLFPLFCSLAFAQGGILGGSGVVGGSGVIGVGVSSAPTVTKIGVATCSFTATCSLTSTPGVLGTHGVILVGWSQTAVTGTFTFTDSAGNSAYQVDIPVYTINSDTLLMASGYITTAIGASGTITVHDSNGASESSSWVAYDVSLLASSSWLDKTVTNGPAFGTSWPTGTTSATSNATNVNIAAWDVGTTNTLVSYSNSCTALDTNLLGSGRYLFTCWYPSTVTGTQSVTMTSGSSDDPAAELGSYKQ